MAWGTYLHHVIVPVYSEPQHEMNSESMRAKDSSPSHQEALGPNDVFRAYKYMYLVRLHSACMTDITLGLKGCLK